MAEALSLPIPTRLQDGDQLRTQLRKWYIDVPNIGLRSSGVEHSIVLDEVATKHPPFVRRKRADPQSEEMVAKAIAGLLVDQKIEPSDSILVPKSDGRLRVVVDCTQLNQHTVPDRYPTPNVEELTDRFHGKGWFTKLDLVSAFHQLLMSEADRPKTAFGTRLGMLSSQIRRQQQQVYDSSTPNVTGIPLLCCDGAECA